MMESKKKSALRVFYFLVAILFVAGAKCWAVEQTLLIIGTGGITGVYYPAGGAIARLINKGTSVHGMRAIVESTGGSVYNINAIDSGQMQLAIVQSDWQFHASQGTSVFAERGAHKDLRALFSMYAEPFTVVARRDADIRSITDLKGKRLNIGNPGSGQRATMEIVMNKMGWHYESFRRVSELRADEQARALCDNEIDAMVYTVGHPNGSIKEAAMSCDVVLVNIQGPEIDELVSQNSYYRKVVIPGGMYRGNNADVNTFGVAATLVSSAKIPAETVYQTVKAVFDNFEEFKKLHPAFATLQKKEMIKAGLSAPLHDGALRYYRENGLL